MFLFYRLLLAHLIGDFLLQTDRIFAWKSKNVWGVFFHASLVFFVSLLLSWPYLSYPLMWAILFLIWISHLITDQAKVFITKKFGSFDNLGMFLLDQSLHIAVLLVVFLTNLSKIKLILKGDFPHSFIYNEDKVILCLIGYIIATFGATILIYYIKKSLLGEAIAILGFGSVRRYLGLVERFFITTFVVLGGFYFFLIPVVFLSEVITSSKKIHKERVDKVFYSSMISLCIALLAGLWLRTVLA